MPNFSRTLRTARWVTVGLILAVSASIAAAAIVILIPDSPVRTGERNGEAPRDMREYVVLHRARNAVVPDYMHIDIKPSSQ